MKTYIMKRVGGAAVAEVMVDDGTPRPLKHLVRHSPTGFEWGYAGSGPADLARSIVGDLMGTDDPSRRLYQAVKFALIATLPSGGGALTSHDILEVIDAKRWRFEDAPEATLTREQEDELAFQSMPNEGPWTVQVCPTCHQPCERRATGLQAVARTGDETLGGYEYRGLQ